MDLYSSVTTVLPCSSYCVFRGCGLRLFVLCCRAIMEHKELLRVPWDWQIGENATHKLRHTTWIHTHR